MNDQRNLIAAIALSVLIMVGWQYLMPAKPPAPPAAAPAATATPSVGTVAPGTVTPGAALAPAVPPGVPPTAAASVATPAASRAAAVERTRRVPILTPSVHGSVALTGARIDDLTLVRYRETPDPDSPEITLLSPAGSPAPYWAEFGWVPADPSVKVPGPEAVWTPTTSGALTPEHPLVLAWDNGEGLRFVRTYAIDADYMFTVSQRVENYGTTPVTLHPFGLLARTGTPAVSGTYILHEGPLGYFNHHENKETYDDLKKAGVVTYTSDSGWAGLIDKYWLTALVPPAGTSVTGRFLHQRIDNTDRYQVDYMAPSTTIAPGASTEAGFRLFAGAKELERLLSYSETYDIYQFKNAIDFGWFWFLTEPFFSLLKILHGALGNMGLAILALTVLIKLAMFPLANKSYASMAKMKKLQPRVAELQARFGEDKMRLQQEMMLLYKKQKVNPLSGCLPVLVQIPVFFALYKVLFVTIEMRHAPFFGWIHDLSVQDPTNLFNLFGLIPWTPPEMFHLGLWPLIMGVTMWLQHKLNPQPPDPVQAKVMSLLPIIFTFLLANFASGLVIYWAWNNALSIAQQWLIMKRLDKAEATS